jgi:hypothetical protein
MPADRSGGVLPFSGVTIRAQVSTDELLDMAKRVAMDPTVFETNAPFFGRASISTGKVDSYFTRMLPSSLQNYAAEAAEGRSVLTGHNHSSLGVGYSLTGTFSGGSGENARVESDFYSIQGLPDTDDAITRIRAGLVRDTSIGFYGGDIICSICDRSWMDWDCFHIPGLTYLFDPKDPESDRATAIGLVDGAHLAEYSLVFDGSTPGCGLIKAYREVDAGRVNVDQARSIENRYRVRLSGNPTSNRFAGWSQTKDGVAVPADRTADAAVPEEPVKVADAAVRQSTDPATTTPTQESAPMPSAEDERKKKTNEPDGDAEDIQDGGADEDTEKSTATADDAADAGDEGADEGTDDGKKKSDGKNTVAVIGAGRAALAAMVAVRAALVAAGQPENSDPVEAIRTLGAEVTRLRPLADDGRRYRADLVEEAISEGVRAFGNGFAVERYTALLERDATTLDEIKGFRDDWRALVDGTVPTGRAIKETSTEKPRGATPAAPDAAFA